MALSTLLVALLATWRLTSLFIREDGPFDLFVKFRSLTGRHRRLEPLGYCVWCLSIWVGLGLAALAISDYWFVLLPLALSAGAVLLDQVLAKVKA